MKEMYSIAPVRLSCQKRNLYVASFLNHSLRNFLFPMLDAGASLIKHSTMFTDAKKIYKKCREQKESFLRKRLFINRHLSWKNISLRRKNWMNAWLGCFLEKKLSRVCGESFNRWQKDDFLCWMILLLSFQIEYIQTWYPFSAS